MAVPNTWGRKTVGETLEHTAAHLRHAGIPAPRLEAEVLLAHLLGLPRAALWTHPEKPLDAGQTAALSAMCSRRTTGEPTAYITGVREFWSLEFRVDARTLIPRPETEHLVEAILGLCPDPVVRIADFGTGSGCVGLSIAHEKPLAQIYGVDVSMDALRVARHNAERLGLADRFHIIQAADLQVLSSLDAVVSNPPYIPAPLHDSLPPEVRDHEPYGALVSGPDGLDVTRQVIDAAARVLVKDGKLALEIDPSGEPSVRLFLEENGWQAVHVRHDLSGRARVVTARRPSPGPGFGH